MSYNVDSTEYIADGPLLITKTALAKLANEPGENRPEVCFIDTQGAVAQCADVPTLLKIVHPHWYGEGSGHTFEKFKEALAKTIGGADILVCFEGGDSYTGLRVRDGVVTEHEVIKSLGNEK